MSGKLISFHPVSNQVAYASGHVKQLLKDLDPGIVRGWLVDIAITGKSTAAAFNASAPLGAAMTARDDADKVCDALMLNIAHAIGADRQMFRSMTFTRLRRHMARAADKDISTSGILADGASVPVSTGSNTAGTVRLVVPYAHRLLRDGEGGKQGTSVLARGGSFEYDGVALPVNVVLANGTIAIATVSVTFRPIMQAGPATFVGGHWVEYRSEDNIARAGQVLLPGVRAYIYDQDPTYANQYQLKGPAIDVERATRQDMLDLHAEQNALDNPQRPNIGAAWTPLYQASVQANVVDIDWSGKPPAITTTGSGTLTVEEAIIHSDTTEPNRQLLVAMGGEGAVIPTVAQTAHGSAAEQDIAERLAGTTIVPKAVAPPNAIHLKHPTAEQLRTIRHFAPIGRH